MPRAKLTKKQIDNLPETDNPTGVCYYDLTLPGFGVRTFPSGRKKFFVEYGPENRRRRMTLGAYGPITLSAAREKAKRIQGSIIDGEDPLEVRRAKRDIPTFSDWGSEYLTRVGKRKKGPQHDRRYLSWASRIWKSRPLDSISRRDVRIALSNVAKDTAARHQAKVKHAKKRNDVDAVKRLEHLNNPGNTQANRFLASVRACFQEALSDGLIPNNPALGIKPNLENPPRSRVLSKEEMARLVEALSAETDPFVQAAFQLLIETGARKSEVLRACWKHFDLDAPTPIWRIPSPKAGHPQVIPLLKSTVAMLRNMPRLGPYVIPGRNPASPRYDLKRPWTRLKQRASLVDVHIHDLRRTFGLHISRESGLHVASKLLRHSDVRVTERVYAPLDIEELGRHLERAKSPAEVIPFPVAQED